MRRVIRRGNVQYAEIKITRKYCASGLVQHSDSTVPMGYNQTLTKSSEFEFRHGNKSGPHRYEQKAILGDCEILARHEGRMPASAIYLRFGYGAMPVTESMYAATFSIIFS
jgi:hypothetical protein